jgi:hypothetical protein
MNLLWLALVVLVGTVVGAILRVTDGGSMSAAAAVAAIADNDAALTDLDVVLFQTSVGNQTRRLQALDAVLIGLAALQIGAVTYVGEDASWLGRILLVLLAICVIFDVLGITGWAGTDGPDPEAYVDALAKDGRTKTRAGAAVGLIESYRENGRSIRSKERVVRWGGAASGLALLAYTVLHVLH